MIAFVDSMGIGYLSPKPHILGIRHDVVYNLSNSDVINVTQPEPSQLRTNLIRGDCYCGARDTVRPLQGETSSSAEKSWSSNQAKK